MWKYSTSIKYTVKASDDTHLYETYLQIQDLIYY